MDDITITISRSVAQALCDEGGILIHDDGEVPGVPNGVLYDTEQNRWTWALDEATRWALENIAHVASPSS